MSWEKWHKEHPYEAHPRERSADKLAESIKSSLGHAGATDGGVRKGEGGVVSRSVSGRAVVSRAVTSKSVVSTPGKKDFKRAAPVKGEKDRADSQRTKIRMAAYNRGKKGETVGPQGEIKPESGNTGRVQGVESKSRKITTEQVGGLHYAVVDGKRVGMPYRNPGMAVTQAKKDLGSTRSADKLAESVKPKDDYTSARQEARAASTAAESGTNTAEKHQAAATAHSRAADLAPDDQKQRYHDSQARNHRYQAKQLEAASRPAAQHEERRTAEVAKAESKQAAGGHSLSDLSDIATDRSAEANVRPTKEAHQAASDAHQKAADEARRQGDAGLASYHQVKAGQHQMVVDSGGRGPTGKVGSMGASTRSAQPKAAKPKALTGQNVHKTLEGVGLQRTPKQTASRDHRGRVVQSASGRTLGRYDIDKRSDGSYRVDVHGGGGGSYGPSERDRARHQENIDKATEALKASGWDVRPGSTGMKGHLEVSPRSAEGKAPAAPAADSVRHALGSAKADVKTHPDGSVHVTVDPGPNRLADTAAARESMRQAGWQTEKVDPTNMWSTSFKVKQADEGFRKDSPIGYIKPVLSGKSSYTALKKSASPASDEEKQAVTGFTAHSYRVNDHLRGGGSVESAPGLYNKTDEHGRPDNPASAAHLDSLMSKNSLPDHAELWRGVRNPDKVFGPVGDRVGHTFSDKAFLSTTMDRDVADKFGHEYGPGATVRIVAPKGTPAIPAQAYSNRYQSQREVILGRDSQFYVHRDEMRDGRRYVELHVLPKEGK